MNIEAFLLCDCATDTVGKLNILGAFDTLFAKKMPATHPSCTIATRVRFQRTQQGTHQINIKIIDQDGQSIAPKLEGSINVKVAENADSASYNIILNIQRLKLENYGEYRIDLNIDNQHLASLPFYVKQPPN
ncbi:MAG: hypothetical protein KAS75_04375 [Planctomycetes bacterium]|nr:hypothetical protein [Planctomycetota bacterium]